MYVLVPIWLELGISCVLSKKKKKQEGKQNRKQKLEQIFANS
jgi:hypothetical protein